MPRLADCCHYNPIKLDYVDLCSFGRGKKMNAVILENPGHMGYSPMII